MPFCCMNQHVNPSGKTWCSACESLIAGAHIDDYVVAAYIGKGTMSAVYMARQRSLNWRVVIKVLPPIGAQANVQDFRREAALLAALTHPSILPIHAYGVINELHSASTTPSPYLVLPYAEQGSLDAIFVLERRHPWPLGRLLPLIKEASEALEYAHGQGVLHRDVKPANLFMMGLHVLLADFGVATLLDASKSHLTEGRAGSPPYMAPEVWRNHPGRYSDQYALAVTCFVLLTGEYPWSPGANAGWKTWSQLHRSTPPRSLHGLRPDLPAAVDLVLQHALAKEPQSRYATLREFAADLKAAAQQNTSPASPPVVRPERDAPVRITVQLTDQPEPLFAPAQSVQPPSPIPVQSVPASVRPQPAPVAAQSARKPEPRPAMPSAGFPSAVKTSGGAQMPQKSVQTSAPATARRTATVQPARATGPRSRTLVDMLQKLGLRGGIVSRKGWWTWGALLLNIVIGLALAGRVYLASHDQLMVENFLLAAAPALLIGPLVALWFRGVTSRLYSLRLGFGLLFGLLDTLFSVLVCYTLISLWLTFQRHWGHDWTEQGQGLIFFRQEVLALIMPALPLVLMFLGIALIGGAVIGLLSAPDKQVEQP
ncbi:MAG TPA: protein kinase [Ktedonosporobacter sp.]|nr:protein kinase [Ktedonosporobacter sp.]